MKSFTDRAYRERMVGRAGSRWGGHLAVR
jgi:hypothetical protein